MADTQAPRAPASSTRAAVWADAEALSQTLGRAFHDDPFMGCLFRDAASRPEKLPRLFRLLFKLALPLGGCLVTSGCEAAALWRPPGNAELNWWHYIANAVPFIDLFGADIPHVLRTTDLVDKQHPHARHWYLQVLGTEPARQGRGYAGLLMRHQLAVVDADGLPAYLETAKATNIPIYGAYGFALTGEVALPGGATSYSMWRPGR
jgi:GNAT superfamily N-acetyltransferase